MDALEQPRFPQLRGNARLSVADLAHRLQVTCGALTNRLRKLKDQQVVLEHTVRLKTESQTERIRTGMGVEVEVNQTRQVIASLLGEPGVSTLHEVNGRWALLTKIEVSSMQAPSLVLERVGLSSGIPGTGTRIHLARYW